MEYLTFLGFCLNFYNWQSKTESQQKEIQRLNTLLMEAQKEKQLTDKENQVISYHVMNEFLDGTGSFYYLLIAVYEKYMFIPDLLFMGVGLSQLNCVFAKKQYVQCKCA